MGAAEWLRACYEMALLIPQRYQWIYPSRTGGWKIACHQGRHAQHCRRDGQCRDIVRCHSI
jgi:hypothetical protein